jgi:hypothetical protein
MKKFFSVLLISGLLAASVAQAAKPGSHAKANHKAGQKARKAGKHAKAHKARFRKAKFHKAAN